MKLNYIELSLNSGLQVLLFTILLIVIYNFDFEEREKNSTQSSSISGSDLMSAWSSLSSTNFTLFGFISIDKVLIHIVWPELSPLHLPVHSSPLTSHPRPSLPPLPSFIPTNLLLVSIGTTTSLVPWMINVSWLTLGYAGCFLPSVINPKWTG